jgi:peptidoglycan-associated lipoprotein
MNRFLLSLLFIGIASSLGLAQVPAADDSHRSTELALEYNFVRANAPPAECDCFSLNGGSISIEQPFRSGHLAGAFDAAVVHGSGISSGGYDLTLSSFTAGLRYRPVVHPHWNPFGQVLVGVAHAGGTLVQGNTPAASDSTLTFASIVGGGLDYRLHGRWSVRLIDADYLLTRSSNGVNDHQNNLRLGAGIAYRLGKR